MKHGIDFTFVPIFETSGIDTTFFFIKAHTFFVLLILKNFIFSVAIVTGSTKNCTIRLLERV